MRSSPSRADPLNPGPVGFAHRGLHGPGIPENSLAAFRAAAEFASGAECDVRLSRDGIPILFHDADLRRMCGRGEQVEASDADWLAGQLLLDTHETIPTLPEVLGPWPAHLPLLIECKTQAGNASALAAAVVAALGACRRNVGIMSLDPAISAWLSIQGRDFPRGLVVDADWPTDFRSSAVDSASPQFIALDARLLSDPWTASMRHRIPVYCWTVRTAEQRAQAEVQADALIWEADGRPRN